MKKFFLTLALLLCASFAVAEEETVIQGPESVQAVFNFDKAPAQTREFKLEQKGNVQYLTIPAAEVPAGTKTIEVHHPWATAQAGEDGFYVFCSGMYGTFQERENGRYTNSAVVMPTFGVKTPRGAMSVILTGLRYESRQVADLKTACTESSRSTI